MNAIESFEEHFGIKGVGVKFYNDDIGTNDLQLLRDVKFCQAVRLARDQHILLDKTIACKGARYALGFEKETKEETTENTKAIPE